MRYSQIIARKPSDTLKAMRRMAKKYATDVTPYAMMSPLHFFALLSSIPYSPDVWDGKKAEIIKRPHYTLNRMGEGGDCDDKAIAMASYLQLNGIPWRFVAVGRKKGGPPTHVYTEGQFGNTWVAFDATYHFNIAGYPMRHYPVRICG